VRAAILTVGVLMVLAGLFLLDDNIGVSLWLFGVGGAFIVGTLLERIVYKPLLREKPGAGWVKTAERFIDPDTGQPVDVFYNPSTGERQYVADEPEKKA